MAKNKDKETTKADTPTEKKLKIFAIIAKRAGRIPGFKSFEVGDVLTDEDYPRVLLESLINRAGIDQFELVNVLETATTEQKDKDNATS